MTLTAVPESAATASAEDTRPNMPVTLYHYTCGHGMAGIRRDGQITPHRHPLIRAALVWLTDLSEPDRYALGLTAVAVPCDRTTYRVDVAAAGSPVPWGRWAHHHRVPRYTRELIETGSLPAHWWVSAAPLPVLSIHARQGIT